MKNIIHTESLTKSFGSTLAVDNVTIKVDEGEIYGFLGLNGAGKTTTIRALLGMIKPTSGSIFLFGKKMGFNSGIWKDIGYMVESPACYPNLTTRENLKVWHRYRNLETTTIVDEVLERLKLTQFADRKAGQLSSGNLQRLGLAKAMMHKPRLLLLDEPANGLDPAGIVEIRHMFTELVRNGSTILISSHILSEISKLASRIGIINEGRMVTELDTEELESQLRRKFVVDTRDNRAAIEFLKSKSVNAEVDADGKIDLKDTSAFENPDGVSTLLVNAGFPPRELFQDVEDLESFFMRTIKPRTNE